MCMSRGSTHVEVRTCVETHVWKYTHGSTRMEHNTHMHSQVLISNSWSTAASNKHSSLVDSHKQRTYQNSTDDSSGTYSWKG